MTALPRCRGGRHVMPTTPLWDHVTSGRCIRCGEKWTREPVVRTAEQLAAYEKHMQRARRRFWKWYAAYCARTR